jgi:oxygen-independent coproporphyrinogen-3 oxidase
MVSSLYLHIPFCHSKCHYCSFSSWPGLRHIHNRYVNAIKTELGHIAASGVNVSPLETIFFGGGTPTVLSADDLGSILLHCRELFSFTKDPEISTEVNPGTIDVHMLTELRKSGFNRVSFGVQSFVPAELQMLGRGHTAQEAVEAFGMARVAGFDNISLDLMYGLPEQNPFSWQTSLETALKLQPEHLSMYQLTIEEGTPFARKLEAGDIHIPDEDSILEMDELNIKQCHAAGLDLYEISNFARTGFRCLHNVNYWENNEYLAAGSGAVSCIQGKRQRRCDDPEEYCAKLENGTDCIIESEKLGLEESFRETVIMGLRMTEGVAKDRLLVRYGLDIVDYYGQTLQKLLREKLVELTSTHLRVTPAGRLVSNYILSELV